MRRGNNGVTFILMTTKQIEKVTALRAEADMHDDSGMVAICDAALAGDSAALAKCGIVIKKAKAAAAPVARQRKSAWAAPIRNVSLDIEDLTGIPRS